MTKAELIDAVANKAGTSKADAEKTVDAFFEVVVLNAKKGDKVAWPGFGSFSTTRRAARTGREPTDGSTGERAGVDRPEVQRELRAEGPVEQVTQRAQRRTQWQQRRRRPPSGRRQEGPSEEGCAAKKAPAKRAPAKKAAPRRLRPGRARSQEGPGQARPRPRRLRPSGQRRRRPRHEKLRPRRLRPSGHRPGRRRPGRPPRRRRRRGEHGRARPRRSGHRRQEGLSLVRPRRAPRGKGRRQRGAPAPRLPRPGRRPGGRDLIGTMARCSRSATTSRPSTPTSTPSSRALDEPSWDQPTPASGWAVRDQISHLGLLRPHGGAGGHRAGRVLVPASALLLAGGRRSLGRAGPRHEPGRAAGLVARRPQRSSWPRSRPLDPATRIPWYGPPMGARSFATARLDGDVGPRPGRRRRRSASTAHRPTACATSPTSASGPARSATPYRGLERPSRAGGRDPHRARRRAMGVGRGRRRTSVSGPALDFCLVVTQRRHPADTDARRRR